MYQFTEEWKEALYFDNAPFSEKCIQIAAEEQRLSPGFGMDTNSVQGWAGGYSQFLLNRDIGPNERFSDNDTRWFTDLQGVRHGWNASIRD